MKRVWLLLALCWSPMLAVAEEADETTHLLNRVADLAEELSLDEAIEPSSLSFDERRFLQAMMAHHGSYRGRVNGVWETASAEGLGRLAQQQLGTTNPTLRIVAQLALGFSGVLLTQDWRPIDMAPGGLQFLYPAAMLTGAGDAAKAIWATEDGSLRITSVAGSSEELAKLHSALTEQAKPDVQPFQVSRDDTHISSVQRVDDSWVYLRSHNLPDGRRGATQVEWTGPRSGEARLIVASLQPAHQPPLALPEDGPLFQAQKAVAWQRSDGLPQGKVVAAGFEISPGDFVTSGAILATCGVLRGSDGLALTPLSVEPATGLAILTNSPDAPHWPEIKVDLRTAQAGATLEARGPNSSQSTTVEVPVAAPEAGGLPGPLLLRLDAETDSLMPGSPLFDEDDNLAGVVLPRSANLLTDQTTMPFVAIRRLRQQLRRANASASARETDQTNDHDGATLQVMPLTCG